MKCDQCNEPHAKKYFVNWLCRLHGIYLEVSLGLFKKVTLSKPCSCKCHNENVYHWCDNCWNDKNHGLQLFPIKEGLVKPDGKKITKDEVLFSIQKYVLTKTTKGNAK